jgi:HEAT repeat protein
MALGRCGGRLAVPALIDAMDHRSSAVVISAIQALGRMVPDSLSLVISKGLEKEDPEIVRETISLIRFLPKRDAEGFLRPLLEHVHWDVRLLAGQAYRERELVVPQEVLRDLIAKEPEYLVRDVLQSLLEGRE